MASVIIAAKLNCSGTNAQIIFQSAEEGIEYSAVLNIELEILIELEFEISQPSPLEF